MSQTLRLLSREGMDLRDGCNDYIVSAKGISPHNLLILTAVVDHRRVLEELHLELEGLN